MNQNLILRIVGVILCIEALCMIPPLLLSVFDGGVDQRAFLYALLICGGVGVLLSLIRADNARLQTRDGFVCVALCWIALSVFGALPYFFSGSCSFIDAIFETVSGLTTTGASIFPSPASLPQGIQFWRALTQWMGGMGILVLMLALLPKLSEGSVNLMKAESPGPISTKLRPRTGETARILYRIYIALTVAEALLLRIAGLPLFDAITTALTTISTGGFSIRDASIAYYQSHLVNWILIFFMFAASVNFTLLYLCVTRRFREALKSEELRVYSLVVVGASAMIAADLIVRTGRDIGSAIENAAFQVTTLISTTGYCTEDFDLWPQFCRCILVLVMFFGGCAGSTAEKSSSFSSVCSPIRIGRAWSARFCRWPRPSSPSAPKAIALRTKTSWPRGSAHRASPPRRTPPSARRWTPCSLSRVPRTPSARGARSTASASCAIVSACAEIRPRDIRHPRRAAVPGAHLHGWRLL